MIFSSIYLVMAEAEPITMHAVLEKILESNVINFLIVLVFIVWIVKKFNVFSAVGDKQNLIKQSVKIAEEEKVKAELELDATKKRLRRAEEEIEKIITDASGIAVSLAERIRYETSSHAEELIQKNKKLIDAEKEMASNEVTHNISKAAFNIAEEHIKQAVDERLHKKFIDEFIDKLTDLKV